MNELKRFENDLRASIELQKKLDEAVKRITEEGKAKNDGEILVAAAKELGYDISIAALEQAKAEAEPMDPAELEAVSGGKKTHNSEYFNGCGLLWEQDNVDEYGHNMWCIATWHCLTALCHNDSKEKDITCWSDYKCVFISEDGFPMS